MPRCDKTVYVQIQTIIDQRVHGWRDQAVGCKDAEVRWWLVYENGCIRWGGSLKADSEKDNVACALLCHAHRIVHAVYDPDIGALCSRVCKTHLRTWNAEHVPVREDGDTALCNRNHTIDILRWCDADRTPGTA